MERESSAVMQDPKSWAGGLQEGLTAAEREQLEREWDEEERERQALIESWKEMYRQQGKDPETVTLDWDAVFAERDEA
jgi:DNA/RNA-binding domain of Phe-tRNA-synthetase-like protein